MLFTIATNSYQTTCTVSERTFNKRQHANARCSVGLSLTLWHYDNECHETLLYDTLPEPSPVSEYELIRSKTYKDSGALIYPSTIFSHFVQNMEDLFCALFGGIMYEKDVLKTLCEHGCGEIPQLIKCGNVHCTIRLHEYVKLYMTIRIHHAIKISNICMSSGHKRNRKMFKLCHE